MAQVVLNTEEYEGYTCYQVMKRLDKATRKKALSAFANYMLRGNIVRTGYNDESWIISDQLHFHTISFRVNEIDYQLKAEKWTGCTADCYVDCLKAYIAFHLGQFIGQSLQNIANTLTKIASMDAEEVAVFASGSCRSHITEFLRLLPGDTILKDQLIESMEDLVWTQKSTSPRKLSEFKYYLRFDSGLKEYWKAATVEKKIFYFPVWLWWKLTSILPLRVTEYLLTPRNCIRNEQGKYYLKVRRSRKKKGNRLVFYLIEKDYEIIEYEIPGWMYEEIEQYISTTVINNHATLGTLLIPRDNASRAWYFSYQQLYQRLKLMCDEIFGDKNYPINLGDTRHLAMINLILSGGSPTICRELAGHEDINISANYYSNISKVVESAVYETCHGHNPESMLNGLNKFPARLPDDKVRIADGWCDYVKIAEGNIDECLKTYAEGRGFGDCINCIHYYPDDPGLAAKVMIDSKKRVDMDGEFLMQMIELVRRGLGYQEDIMQAMVRIRGSATRYGRLLIRKEMENKDVKAEKN